jgi:hypothetical protein
MSEIAEFVGGHMDGRTIEVRDPAPDIITVPVPVNFDPAELVADRPISATRPVVRIEEYRRIGRNDVGHLRYSAILPPT